MTNFNNKRNKSRRKARPTKCPMLVCYNRLKHNLKRDYFKMFLEQVNELNPKNMKEFWNSINNLKKKRNLTGITYIHERLVERPF